MTTVTLTAEQATAVHDLVAEGRFASPDEAVNFLLAEVLCPAPQYSAAELAEIQQGIDEADRGEFVSQEEVEAFFEDWKRNG
jgi:Arc/MetJ-type ribon-helix-helix transcriptional regulator